MVGNLSLSKFGSLLAAGVPVVVNKNPEGLLLSVAAKRNIITLKSLLAEGRDVNERSRNGETDLMLAVFNNRIKFAWKQRFIFLDKKR